MIREANVRPGGGINDYMQITRSVHAWVTRPCVVDRLNCG